MGNAKYMVLRNGGNPTPQRWWGSHKTNSHLDTGLRTKDQLGHDSKGHCRPLKRNSTDEVVRALQSPASKMSCKVRRDPYWTQWIQQEQACRQQDIYKACRQEHGKDRTHCWHQPQLAWWEPVPKFQPDTAAHRTMPQQEAKRSCTCSGVLRPNYRQVNEQSGPNEEVPLGTSYTKRDYW